MSRNNDVLIAYYDQDKTWLPLLAERLDQHKRGGTIDQWAESEIVPGADWLDTNKDLITGSKVVVILASAHFFISDFNRKDELSIFLSRAKLFDLTVLWLAVGPCPPEHPLSHYPHLNTNPAMPLSAFPSGGSGLPQEMLEIVDKIEQALTAWNNARRAIEDLLDGPLMEDNGDDNGKEKSGMSRTVKIATGGVDIAGDSFKVVFERQQRHFDKDSTLLLYVGTDATLVKVSFHDQDSIILGRASDGATPDVDLTPFFDREYGVSRKHVRIHLENEQLFITDLKAVNKTHVNGELLPPGEPRVLENGDLIRLGMMLVIIRFDRPEGFA